MDHGPSFIITYIVYVIIARKKSPFRECEFAPGVLGKRMPTAGQVELLESYGITGLFIDLLLCEEGIYDNNSIHHGQRNGQSLSNVVRDAP